MDLVIDTFLESNVAFWSDLIFKEKPQDILEHFFGRPSNIETSKWSWGGGLFAHPFEPERGDF